MLLYPKSKFGFVNADEDNGRRPNSNKEPGVIFCFNLPPGKESENHEWQHQNEVWDQPCPLKQDHRLHENKEKTVK